MYKQVIWIDSIPTLEILHAFSTVFVFHQRWNINSVWVFNCTCDVTDCNNLTAFLMDKLCCPGTHIAEPLK